MFNHTQRTAYFDDYGEQSPLTPYMDQFALRDSTAIEFLVDGEMESEENKNNNSKKKKKKKNWRDRMAKKEGKKI